MAPPDFSELQFFHFTIRIDGISLRPVDVVMTKRNGQMQPPHILTAKRFDLNVTVAVKLPMDPSALCQTADQMDLISRYLLDNAFLKPFEVVSNVNVCGLGTA